MISPACPTRDILFALAAGRLSGDTLESVASHLDDCPRCLGLMDELEPSHDPLVRALRHDARPANADKSSATTSGSRYRSVRFHAKGGLGEVHVAEDEELHREVALKRIQPKRAGDADSRRRFLLEAEITARLEHPGIVPVYGLVQDEDGQPCYAMRFIQGESLHQAIKDFHSADMPGRDPGERSLALRQLLQRFITVCNTMAYAHSRGVLHRDLKPSNIMLGKYGETLVVDWGLAKPFERDETARAGGEETLAPSDADDSDSGTRTGEAVGTPAYMSPEQAAGRHDQIGPASDIYSLGATLYALLTGEAPFKKDAAAILEQVKRGDFPRPRQHKPGISAGLEAVCLKAMALEPAQRYATALELAADVEHWLADEPVTAYREPWLARSRRWARRRRGLVGSLAAAVLVAIVLGGVGAWWLGRQEAAHLARLARQEEQARLGIEGALQQVESLRPHGNWRAIAQALAQALRLADETGTRELHQRLSRMQEDLQLVARLESIRLEKPVRLPWESRKNRSATEYADAFAQHGFDLRTADLQILAERITSSAFKEELVGYLDDWTLHETDSAVWERLLAVARRADPNIWRDQFRDPNKRRKVENLVDLVEKADISHLTPSLVVSLVTDLEDGPSYLALLRKAQQKYPTDFWLNFQLANRLRDTNPEEAIGYYRAALAVRPRSAVYNNLGTTLLDKNEVEAAITAFRRANDLDPMFAAAHFNLGVALKAKGDHEGAIRALEKAVKVNTKDATGLFRIGVTLQHMGEFTAAVEAFDKAIRMDPQHGLVHGARGHALLLAGHFAKARDALELARKWLPKDHELRPVTTQHIEQCEQLIKLEQRLTAVLEGNAKPSDDGERLALAQLCLQYKQLPRAAALFYNEAFTKGDPKFAEDHRQGHRFHAACAAALAGCGKGKDTAKVNAAERTRWRKQALKWLQTDLTAWSRDFDKANQEQQAEIHRILHRWQLDANLAGVRDAKALDALPEEERESWRQFWEEVQRLFRV